MCKTWRDTFRVRKISFLYGYDSQLKEINILLKLYYKKEIGVSYKMGVKFDKIFGLGP